MGSILYKDGTMITSLKFEESDNKKYWQLLLKEYRLPVNIFGLGRRAFNESSLAT